MLPLSSIVPRFQPLPDLPVQPGQPGGIVIGFGEQDQGPILHIYQFLLAG